MNRADRIAMSIVVAVAAFGVAVALVLVMLAPKPEYKTGLYAAKAMHPVHYMTPAKVGL